MRHRIEFEMKVYSDNAAFDEYPERELARILRDVALSVEIATDYAEGTIRDINGNKVGTFCMEVNDEEGDLDEDPRGLSRSDAGSIFDDLEGQA